MLYIYILNINLFNYEFTKSVFFIHNIQRNYDGNCRLKPGVRTLYVGSKYLNVVPGRPCTLKLFQSTVNINMLNRSSHQWNRHELVEKLCKCA